MNTQTAAGLPPGAFNATKHPASFIAGKAPNKLEITTAGSHQSSQRCDVIVCDSAGCYVLHMCIQLCVAALTAIMHCSLLSAPQPSFGGSSGHHTAAGGHAASAAPHAHSDSATQRAPQHKTHQQLQQEQFQQKQQLAEGGQAAKRQKMQEAQTRLAAAEKGGGLDPEDIDALFE